MLPMKLGVLMVYWIIFAVQWYVVPVAGFLSHDAKFASAVESFYAYRAWISECSWIYESKVSRSFFSHRTK
ncbi:hypothetical protein BDR05DRAFT_165001 [Suillus weaverae]|nr:hypothetical protein BDR05DRAFT_165001 [Suillus weaverae]